MCFQFLFFAQNKILKLIIFLPIPVPREKEWTNSTIFGSDLEEEMRWQHSVKPRNWNMGHDNIITYRRQKIFPNILNPMG